MTENKTLGIVAGSGQFPILVAKGAAQAGIKVVAVGFKGQTEPDLQNHVQALKILPLGKLGKLISFFKKHGVTELTMAGAVNKPKALSLRPDWRAVKFMFRLRNKSDNSILSSLAGEFEAEGMRVVSGTKFVPDLHTPSGVLTGRKPTDREWADIRFGWPLAKQIGQMDIGQCLVVKEQMVVAVEAIEGTNETILRAGDKGGEGCVVIKVFKPGQDERIDAPAVGPDTIRHMRKARATCLCVEAGKSLFFDLAESLAEADRAGICVVGFSDQDLR